MAVALFFETAVLCHCRDYRGVVSGHDTASVTIEIKRRVKVFPLAFMCHEIVKARSWVVIIFPHVPLANVGSFIS